MKVFNLIFLILFLLTILFFDSNAQTQLLERTYPSYESVVRHFYSKYELPDRGTKLYFEKRPYGYYVSTSNEYPYDTRKDQQLFWSIKTKSFHRLKNFYRNSKSGKLSESEMNVHHLSSYIKHIFDYCPFAGYPGWQEDVIDIFGKKKNLPDTIRYGLARAYTTYAMDLFETRSGFAKKANQFKLPKGRNSLTSAQLKKYRKYFHLGHKHYYKLHQQNPDFETVVGKAYIKYCNEVMNTFLQLRYFQNEKEARKELKPDLYDEFYIDFAKNFLNSCPPNAVLITYGDNDTYPLLYVQAQLGIRKDVLIVNSSLIALDRYINHLREGVLDATPLLLPFEPSFYEGNKNNQFLPSKTKDTTEVMDVIHYLMDEKNAITFGKTAVAAFPSTYNYLKIDQQKMIDEKIVPAYQQDNTVDSMTWKTPNIVIKNNFILFSLIAKNNWQRPICIAATCRPNTFIGLNKYFHLEGLVYRLYPVETKKKSYLHAGLNTVTTYDKLINEFSWGGIDKIEAGRKIVYSTYFVIFGTLVDELIEEGEIKKAEIVLDKFFKVFPNEIHAFDFQIATLAKSYFKINKKEKGEKIALQLISNLGKIENPTDNQKGKFAHITGIFHAYKTDAIEKALEKIESKFF